MDIQVRKLTPELVDDYLHFFDVTPHANEADEYKCYCVWWSSDDSTGRDYTTAEMRREIASQYVKTGKIQGYLAYNNDDVVGWCNTNTKWDCLKCPGGPRLVDTMNKEEYDSGIKIKSVFCFVISPNMRRKGISKLLLEQVCKDAELDGFNYVEAIPNINFISENGDFLGPKTLYEKCGFYKLQEYPDRIIMRKNTMKVNSVGMNF